MEVDHFNPTLRQGRHAYVNLIPAFARCNNSKRKKWPNRALRKAGIRFLDPTKEQDYGVHIFENPLTNHLEGVTPAGRYHIDMLDLNNESFVFERRMRAEYLKKKRESPELFDGSFTEGREAMELFERVMETYIPMIPPPPTPDTPITT